MEVRGDAMARLYHQQTNPEVQAYMERVDASTCRGPRKDYTTADAARRAERKSARASALELWEIGHRKEMLALRQRGTHNGDASLASEIWCISEAEVAAEKLLTESETARSHFARFPHAVMGSFVIYELQLFRSACCTVYLASCAIGTAT
eukprot:scaffold16588_cov68-Skeletonema_marinoi.AAC.2